MSTIVHLVRHGEVFNPDRILYGRLPGYHLSDRGRAMASTTARAFTGHDVTVLKASPLTRAQETAQPFQQVTGLDIVTDDELIEAGNDLEGYRIKGWRSQLWNPTLWHHLKEPMRPSWGEPYQDICDRMWAAVGRAREEARGHEAIMVSHQLPIVMIQRDYAGKRLAHNPAVRQCSLASVTSLIFDDDTVVRSGGPAAVRAQVNDLAYSEPAQRV
ncbi:histidine phosphatase family protein [Corynebacterium kroppenstedtii]|uniref:histidine phosphatase family protein n=1 Tax=Corynebacterium sp. PCR 32 TaxID=3351342 RepID=UPI0030A3CC56